MSKLPIVFLLSLLLAIVNHLQAQTDYTRFVNPFIGTDGTGHTFPGPCRPFGMVQPGPDNRDNGWDYTSGYQYRDSFIIGFSQTRANGTGINEFGDVLLQPLTSATESPLQRYDKQSEQASPGFYTVQLSNKVAVDLTCTERVAFHRYHYPAGKAFVLANFQHGLKFMSDSFILDSKVTIENNNSISGFCHTRNWVERKYFFLLQFNVPFQHALQLPKQANDNAPRYLLSFDLPKKELMVKIALSSVSVEGAKSNLKTELPAWNFNHIVNASKKIWNSYLSKIDIAAPAKEKSIFYSALYRLFIQPSNIADADGRYRGPDDRIHQAVNKAYYSTLSLWDTYRAAHPLYTLLVPDRVDGFVRSMISHSQQAGFLPIWTAWAQDNYCMIGNHAIPVITDAYLKGFKGFDAAAAMKQMTQTSSLNHINSNWTLLEKYGYYPFDSLDNESVSRVLEHGVDDYFLAVMADKMGRRKIAEKYYQRAGNYRHLFDPATWLFRGKNSKGEWRTPFDPLTATSPLNNPGDYTEANAWQYFWTPAQYDVAGMMQLLGGKEQFTAKLDSFFTIHAVNPNKHLGQEAMIGQYAHANEPSHHIAWLYAFTNKPETGTALVKRICREFYNNTPDGMIGNDDCGQMSAWYIFAALGFYPANPAEGNFVLGNPLVEKAIISLPNNKKLVISNNHLQAHPIKITFNGKTISGPTLRYQQLMQGGHLQFSK